MTSRIEVIEIQRRFNEKVNVIINKGKRDERVEIVTDLPEPSFNEWIFQFSIIGPPSEILVRRSNYGASRSPIKPKLPASEIWSIFCSCSDTDPTGCDHIKSFVHGDLSCLVGWSQILDRYYSETSNRGKIVITDFILENSASIPKDLIKLYQARLSVDSITSEERKDSLKAIKNYGFPSSKSFLNWLTFIAINEAVFPYSKINININEISKYLKSEKLEHFLNIKRIVDMRVEQDYRFSLLSDQISHSLENGKRVDFSNIGNDYCLYYSECRVMEELNG